MYQIEFQVSKENDFQPVVSEAQRQMWTNEREGNAAQFQEISLESGNIWWWMQ